jgi:1-acyl-sn-glycerol-3-phosphate acyltransferase
MAKEELFRFGPFGWLLRQYQVFPVSRQRIDHQAMKRAVSLLEQGELVVIFPEGTRGNGVRLRPAKPGIGLIAARSRAPVIPVLHRGTEKALPRGAWFPKPYRVSVRFGEPLLFGDADTGRWQEQIETFSQTIMKRIAVLQGEQAANMTSFGDRTDIARKAATAATASDHGEEKSRDDDLHGRRNERA